MPDPNETAETHKLQLSSYRPTYIVGIGASAGGLEALERLFQHVPADTGMAFVVVQHLSPDFRSLMDELLARWTRMKIHRVTDGMEVEANSIYLIPPKKEMTISDGRLFLEDKDPELALSLPIDHFLKSLAIDQQRQSIAVILSGTGSDGSRGIDEIKRAGGLVIAQTEQTAKFDGMPHAARETGAVNLTLDPEDVGPALVRYAEGVEPGQLASEFGSKGVDEDGLSVIYRLLRDRFGIDFSHYKLNTIVRRTERRLQLIHIDTIQDYAQRLADDSEELDSLYRDLLVGVTRFFRDSEAYQQLERHLDAIIATKGDQDELRAWVAGCATGEEAYSIAILLRERVCASGKSIPIRIFATDVHQRSLIVAGAAFYSEESIEDLSPELREKYFTRQESGFILSEQIRHDVVFAPHNIIKDAPFTRMDLISCRNLLIYLQPSAQQKAISLFHFGLNVGGILFLGPSETPGEIESEFEVLDPRWKIYSKKRDIRLPIELRAPVILSGGPLRISGLPEIINRPQRNIDPSLLSTYEVLLNDFVPSALLISERHELIHVFGKAGHFLQHRIGRVSRNVLDQLDSSLRIAITGAIQQIRNKRKSSVTYRGIIIRLESGEERVQITVRSVAPDRAASVYYLVLIEATEPVTSVDVRETVDEPSTDFSRLNSGEIEDMEAELRYTRESLQATVEELETSNEELQATNEELVASNEELQSTNEELHSVNEELYTVNAEHQRKIQELTTLTDDMENVLTSTRVHTVFLDRELRIRKFTPLAAEIFGLLPHDLGRSFEGFTHRLRHDHLNDDLRQVLQTGQPIEAESQDGAGNWFLVRILPYQTKHSSDGILLSLIEIAKLKRAQQDLTLQVEQRDRFLAILSHELRNPLAAVVNGCKLIERKSLSHEATGLIAVVNRQLTHMASLLDDLLDVARITNGKIELNQEILDVRHVVTAAAEAVQHLLDERHQTLDIKLPPEPVIVLGDAVRLQQVAANLLSNASKYSPQNARVSIEIYRNEKNVELRVIDNGQGIPPELVHRVFEPFEQLGKTNLATDRGLGLGLTVANSLVQLHGGTISANSDGIGHGSEFLVRLPLTGGSVDRPAANDHEQREGDSRKIVLVEDMDDARQILHDLLTDDGYRVRSAATGREGLELIENCRPDAAIIDIGLPDIDGYEVARAIRKKPEYAHLRLIALTGFGQVEDKNAAIAAGFNAHLTKPVTLSKLEAALRDRR